MHLPNLERAEIAEEKLVRYLLSATHPAGGSKAAFFLKHGFAPEAWRDFAQALLRHAADNEIRESTQTAFGVRYVIDGLIAAPDGSRLNVRSVWFISRGNSIPAFATAHPLERKTK